MSGDLLLGSGLTAMLILVAFLAGGGTDLAPNTWVQVGLTVIGAAAAIALVLAGRKLPPWGAAATSLFAALVALSYLSIAWSVQPATSWLEANRTLSYLAAFGAAAAFARLAPGRWRAVLGAVGTALVVLAGYALLTKVFPGALDPDDPLGRLRLPFDYWNAVGLAAAMGLAPCLWAGAGRGHSRGVRALSAPAISILVSALLLSYSRGALAAAVIGIGCWFALVPLRLRAALIFMLGTIGGAAITAWALTNHSIYADGVGLGSRISAGHAFGLVLLVVLALTTAAGFAAASAVDRVPLAEPTRHRIGTVLVCCLALIPIGAVAALAVSSRGLTGEVSHLWSRLTNTNAAVGDQPGRLVQLSNSRPTYWHEGLEVGEHHLLAGVGARGFETAQLRYSKSTWNVDAHSYVIETFADFGLIGIALSLALLIAWAVATNRTLGPRWWQLRAPRGPPPADAIGDLERIGLVTLLVVVVTFGLHSLIDWTWFIPGTTVIALVCAGWLAGRGPLGEPVSSRRRRVSRSPGAAMLMTAIAALTAIAIFALISPLRSFDQVQSAIAALVRGDTAAALTDARGAASSDPVSIDPRFVLATIYSGEGQRAAARRELLKATTIQPANPATWEQLGCFDLGHYAGAVNELARVYALEPTLGRELGAEPDLCKALSSGAV